MSDDGSAYLDIGERHANIERAAALRQTTRPARRDEPSQASLHDGSFGRANLTDAALGEVLNAAVCCFMALGYDATSIETVAKRAGYSRRLLYYYFNIKEDLFRRSVSYTWRRSTSSTIRFDEGEILDPEVGLTLIGHKFAAFWMCPVTIGLMRMAIVEQKQFPNLMYSLIDAGINKGLVATKAYIERLACLGVFTDLHSSDIAARQFIGSINEVVLWSRLVKDEESELTEQDATLIVKEAVKTFLSRYNRHRCSKASSENTESLEGS